MERASASGTTGNTNETPIDPKGFGAKVGVSRRTVRGLPGLRFRPAGRWRYSGQRRWWRTVLPQAEPPGKGIVVATQHRLWRQRPELFGIPAAEDDGLTDERIGQHLRKTMHPALPSLATDAIERLPVHVVLVRAALERQLC